MMRRFFFYLAFSFVVVSGALAYGQGTRLWTQSNFDELEQGKPEGVAITSDGRLISGPSATLVTTTPSTYVWSVAADKAGNAYLGTGSPATVLKVAPDGKTTKLFSTGDLTVQVVRVGPDGSIYAATLPSGKVYKLDSTATNLTDQTAKVIFDPASTAEKPKYVWDMAFDSQGRLYIATGGPAGIYRVDPRAPAEKPDLFFKSDEQHIRALAFDAAGNLIAGSDGTGLVYRIDKSGKGYVIYDSARREITAVAVGANENIYAAAVGQKGRAALPPLPVTGNTGVTIKIVQPGSVGGVSGNTLIPNGSEIDEITPSGAPRKLWDDRQDIVYALRWTSNGLLAATGNRGRIYATDPAVPGVFTDIAHLDASQGMAFAPTATGVYIATSNSGRLFRLEDKPAASNTYLSDVFDAGIFSRWGRVELRGSQAAELYLRSGNVENPEINWTDWTKVTPNTKPSTLTNARYAQWKAVLSPDSRIDSVTLNYLPKNLAPMVDDLVVQGGARMNPQPAGQGQTVQITFPRASANPGFVIPQDPNPPLIAQKDKNSITARWTSHDDNGDNLMYSIYYRGDNETTWRLLKDQVNEKYYSWDAAQLPDGGYTLRVIASDAPSHNPGETLMGERVSERFEVDTTPPVPGQLTATMANNQIHALLEATDATSAIDHAEYSLDAGPWQYLEPAGKLSDSPTEHYDFTLPVTGSAAEHTLAVRIYDRFENVATAKTVIRSAGR